MRYSKPKLPASRRIRSIMRAALRQLGVAEAEMHAARLLEPDRDPGARRSSAASAGHSSAEARVQRW